MAASSPDPSIRVFGREAELARLEAFLVSEEARRVLVLAGSPGIGKTTLWEAGLEIAGRHGIRVLSARPTDAEASLAFAALIDLLDGIATEELGPLPPPQREALEVALLRAAPGPRPEAHAIALGFLNALRALAARQPLLLAVDDVQWLDEASTGALAYALRRLEDGGIRVLLTRRPETGSSLEEAMANDRIEVLELHSLSVGATRRVLADRLHLRLAPPLMRRLVDSTLGNPLFALEIGRKLVEDGTQESFGQLPVPESVEDLLGTRVAGLPPPVRRLLLAVALGPGLRAAQLEALAGPIVLEQATERGVLVVDGDAVRASHPLLAEAARRHASGADVRTLHQDLAAVTVEDELRTRHLALAAVRPDRELATTVAAAARSASARGAVHAAAELADHALRLTPPGDDDRSDRVLELGRYLEVAGEPERLTELLTPLVDDLPRGAARVRACVLLSSGVVTGNDDVRRHLERALAESGDDPELRVPVIAELWMNTSMAQVRHIGEAEAWAADALAGRALAPEAQGLVLHALAWMRALRGRPVDDVCEQFDAVSHGAAYIAQAPQRAAAQRLAWRGQVAEARAEVTRLLALADERGELSSYLLQRLHLCELELRAGRWDVAARLLDDWADLGADQFRLWPLDERCRALLAAGLGAADDAERWARAAIERAEATGVWWDRLEATRALGAARLLRGDAQGAADVLRSVWRHTEREGVDEPGTFPVAPDLVEALVELGVLAEATEVTGRLSRLAVEQEHPWGLATARRAAATVRLGESYDAPAAAALRQAARDLAELGLPFDAARTLLTLGRIERRARKWGLARATLLEAADAFEALGSPGWAEAAQAELARVGARRPSGAGELTRSERRVAELAARGLANKEIASELVVTVSTVEYHLSRAYAKLGIRSRAQLAPRLADVGEPESADV